ncbi:hypothetical protein EDB80DRAFT_768029 [Ilyonectria destructans]|nr:hypothetical protein EDB80DRAFT_768029 [Ilyonectria destructans]
MLMEEASADPHKRKTCLACTKSKRSCDKGVPTCQRCLDRQITCQYPKARRYARTKPAPSKTQSAEGELDEEQPLAVVNMSILSMRDATSPNEEWWFLSPSTWTTDRSISCTGILPNHTPAMHLWIDELRDWLRIWIEQGHNPFIHKQLYLYPDMPACLQDALSTFATYLLKTKQNEVTTMNIVQRRADILIAAQGVAGETPNWPSMPTIDHLARVQALFIYQYIRLFDGNIRQRALADRELPILALWCKQLWESAVSSINRGDFIGIHDETEDPTTRLWRSWILSESVRRTCMIAKFMECVYVGLRDGWTENPGGICFTARRGLWNTDTPRAWAQLVQSADPLSVTCFAADRLFSSAKSCDVDSYSTLLLKLLWGIQTVEAWASR